MDPGGGKVSSPCPKNFHLQMCSHDISVTKIKQDLIHKAKVKKAYAKIKAQEEQKKQQKQQIKPSEDESKSEDNDEKEKSNDTSEDEAEQLHPTRQLMLKDEEAAQTGATRESEDADPSSTSHSDGQRRRTRRPGYYDKQLAKAEERRAEAEARAEEAQRRREERERKLAERDRYKRAMAKTRGKDGKKKLGRESTILLDKVKKLVGEQ